MHWRNATLPIKPISKPPRPRDPVRRVEACGARKLDK
jgi:hypothetical protein